MYKNIMFDLDGTITDSERAITSSVRYALDRQGITDQPIEKLRRFIGPSLFDSFTREFGLDAAAAEEAVRDYRQVYEAGRMYDVDVYPGIEELLKELSEAGSRLILVTSKPEVFSGRIIEKVGLRKYFCYISAALPATKDSDKTRLIENAVDALGLDKDECVMIGDTRYDIDGAKRARVASIGVTYGFGSRDQLEEAGADHIAGDAREIGLILLGR